MDVFSDMKKNYTDFSQMLHSSLGSSNVHLEIDCLLKKCMEMASLKKFVCSPLGSFTVFWKTELDVARDGGNFAGLT